MVSGKIDLTVKRRCKHKDKMDLLSHQFPVDEEDKPEGIKSVHLKYCPECHAIIDDSFVLY